MDTEQVLGDDASTIRRLNLERVLGHGDLKLLAEKLNKNANYLSQTFSLKCKRPLTAKLARSIEQALDINTGTLDRNPEEVDIEVEREDENRRAQQDIQRITDSNKMSDLAFELLRERLKKMIPNVSLTINADMTFEDWNYTIPIFIHAPQNKPLLVVQTTRSQSGLAKLVAQNDLLSSMSITGSHYGLIATESGGQLLEKWFASVNGKISAIKNRPEFN